MSVGKLLQRRRTLRHAFSLSNGCKIFQTEYNLAQYTCLLQVATENLFYLYPSQRSFNMPAEHFHLAN